MGTTVTRPDELLLRELRAGRAQPAPPEPVRGAELRTGWIRSTMAWGLIGVLFPAAAVALIVAGGQPAGFELAALIVAGALQGFCLGVGQALALGRALPALRRRAWAGHTAVGAAVAWMAGAVPAAASFPFGSGIDLADVVFLGSLTLVAVVSVGVAQWFELRHTLLRAGPWVALSGLAWLAGLGVLTVAAAIAAESGTLAVSIALAVVASIVALLILAGLTGLSIAALVGADDRARERQRAEYIAETAWLLRTVERVKRGPRRERLRTPMRRRT